MAITQFLGSDLWKAATRQAKKASSKRAAIAYVTKDALAFSEGDLLIADASLHAIAAGQTSATVLEALLERGVALHSCPGLHAKLVVLDNVGIASSGNLSERSVGGGLLEAGVMTDHPATVAGALDFIHQLREQSTRLTRRQIKELLKIPVTQPLFPDGRGYPRSKRPRPVKAPKTWICSTYEMARMKTKDHQEAERGKKEAERALASPDSEVGWVYYRKNSRFGRVCKPGDSVIWLWRPLSSSSEPEWAYRAAPVIRVEKGANYNFVYTETFKDSEETKLSWPQFQRLCTHVSLPFRITVNTERELPQDFADHLHNRWSQAQGH